MGLEILNEGFLNKYVKPRVKVNEAVDEKFKLRFYKIGGNSEGELDHEEFFTDKNDAINKYKEVFKRELFSLNPTLWEKQGNDWKKISPYTNESLNDKYRINYDDDLVIVKKGSKVIYKGLEDYEPMKNEPWKFDGKKYTLDGGYTKKLVKESLKDDRKAFASKLNHMMKFEDDIPDWDTYENDSESEDDFDDFDESLNEADTLAKPLKRDVKNQYKRFDANRDYVNRYNKNLDKKYKDMTGNDMDDETKEVLYKKSPDKFKYREDSSKKLERKSFPYYVTYYEEVPYYHPEEGGYYNSGMQAMKSVGFESKQEANEYAKELADELELTQKHSNHYSSDSKYIGDNVHVYIEKEKDYLSREQGDQMYESLNEDFVSIDWEKAIKSDIPYYEIANEIGWGFTYEDLEELARLHKAGINRDKIEDLLTDCNFHTECKMFKNGVYDLQECKSINESLKQNKDKRKLRECMRNKTKGLAEDFDKKNINKMGTSEYEANTGRNRRIERYRKFANLNEDEEITADNINEWALEKTATYSNRHPDQIRAEILGERYSDYEL